MHNYFIEIYKYTSEGSLESRPYTTMTADTPLQLRKIRDQYAYEYQTRIDEETGETVSTGNKMYKVKAYKLQYKAISDLDAEISQIFE